MKVERSGSVNGKNFYVVYYNEKRYIYLEGEDVIGVSVTVNRSFTYNEHQRFIKAKNIIAKVQQAILEMGENNG